MKRKTYFITATALLSIALATQTTELLPLIFVYMGLMVIANR